MTLIATLASLVLIVSLSLVLHAGVQSGAQLERRLAQLHVEAMAEETLRTLIRPKLTEVLSSISEKEGVLWTGELDHEGYRADIKVEKHFNIFVLDLELAR